jgi:hypothetical protein
MFYITNTKDLESVVEFFKTYLFRVEKWKKDKRQMVKQGTGLKQRKGINLRAIIWQLCYDDL